MTVQKLSVKSIARRRKNADHDLLEFTGGVNVLVGEGNTGKTKWLESIDYILGDEISVDERENDDIYSSFDAFVGVIAIGHEELKIERRVREPGGLRRVFVNGQSFPLEQYCDLLTDKIGIPRVRYPQGNPYAPRRWPELGWRSLMRHVYRRERYWSDIADRQPPVEQHACLVQFLGVAERLFSTELGELVEKNRTIDQLQARREQFISILDEISQELLGATDLPVAVTPESLAAAQERLHEEARDIGARRARILIDVKNDVQSASPDAKFPDIDKLSDQLARLEQEYEEVGVAVAKTQSRKDEAHALHHLLADESAKLDRALAAGSVLADLKVTHCPACDRPIAQSLASVDHCYVCGRESDEPSLARGNARLEFEKAQVESECAETADLVQTIENELVQLKSRFTELQQAMATVRASLRPVRKAAAAVLPPELFHLDVQYGRIQEKNQQLGRLAKVLAKRDDIAQQILTIQKELAELEAAVAAMKSDTDLMSCADRLQDGFGTYFNRITKSNPKSWLGQAVTFRLDERSFEFRVGNADWRTKLGATQRLYFLLAYHFALLSLIHFDESRYPGLLILDFPAKVEDGTTVADKENFLLEPFVELLRKKEMTGCQVIAAGRSFQDLKNVNRIPFTHIWK